MFGAQQHLGGVSAPADASSETDHYNTPPRFVELVHTFKGRRKLVDPCSNDGSMVGADLAFDGQASRRRAPNADGSGGCPGRNIVWAAGWSLGRTVAEVRVLPDKTWGSGRRWPDAWHEAFEAGVDAGESTSKESGELSHANACRGAACAIEKVAEMTGLPVDLRRLIKSTADMARALEDMSERRAQDALLGYAIGDMLRWAESNPAFTNLTPEQCCDHAESEVSELHIALYRSANRPACEKRRAAVTEEACDLASVALHTALRAGATIDDLTRELQRKLEVNKARTCGPDGRHVKEAPDGR